MKDTKVKPWRAVIRSNQHGPRYLAVATDTQVGGYWEPQKSVGPLTAENVKHCRMIAATPLMYHALQLFMEQYHIPGDKQRESRPEIIAALEVFAIVEGKK